MDTQTIILILVVVIVGVLALVYIRRRRAKSTRDVWEYLRQHRELFEQELEQRRYSDRRGFQPPSSHHGPKKSAEAPPPLQQSRGTAATPPPAPPPKQATPAPVAPPRPPASPITPPAAVPMDDETVMPDAEPPEQSVETNIPDWLSSAKGGQGESTPDAEEVDELLDDVIRYQSPVVQPPLRPINQDAKPASEQSEQGKEAIGGRQSLPATEAPPEPQPAMPDYGSSASTEHPPATPSDREAVHFSTYYPPEVKPHDWQPMKAYLYRQSAAGKVAEDAQQELGDRLPGFRKVMQVASQPVAEGALVTATPTLPGFQFNPPSLSVGFYETWHRFDFKLRAIESAPLNQAANGALTFTVEGVIVAEIPLSVFVTETLTNRTLTSAEAKLYQAIFCSYSHADTTIVERVERAYKALGLEYLRDVMTLKAGQDWSDELLNMIDKADIFQLFWSHTAAASQHVRYEWEHALKIAVGREKFIRPVYWEQPMPPTPSELGHLHFAYQPDLGK